ncbi:MAG: methionyl-tRNA formyltransferase, partial [Bacteroidetes bacterium CG_4_8_14_3_um_filter_31_14]
MRIVFMGTPQFAVESLKELINSGNDICAIVTSPDKPAGRGLKLKESEVKQFANSINIPVLQPVSLKDNNFIEQLKSFDADIFVVVAFRMLPETIWQIPPKGTINLHASLLPNYRGAAPINWAIINGEKITGVTTFFIEKEIDTGNILDFEEVEILEKDNAGNLHDKLMITGAKLLTKTINSIENSDVESISQKQFIISEKTLKTAPK